MNLTSREIIKSLNERLFTQSAVFETLCELLISKEVVTHEELEELIYNNIETRKDELKELTKKLKPTKIQVSVQDEFNNAFDEGLMEGMYYGPVGEA